MDLRVSKNTLLPALAWAAGVAPRRSTLPILQHVLLRADGARLRILASNLDIEAETTVAMDEPAEPAEATVSAQHLLDIARNVEPGLIRLTRDGERIRLTAGRSRFRLGTLPAEDFPAMETPYPKGGLDVPASTLHRLIRRASYAMARGDVRYFLNGMCLEFRADGVRAVATDGHRLATHVEPLDAPPEQDVTLLIPADAVMALARVVDKTDSTARLDLYEGHVVVQVGGARLSIRQIEGRYPDWRRVVPHTLGHQAIIDRNALELALARAGLLSDEKYKGAALTFARDTLTLECGVKGADTHAKVEMDVDFQHPEYRLSVNLAYLDDALKHLDADRIQWGQAPGGQGAVLITPVGDERTQAIIMPMKL